VIASITAQGRVLKMTVKRQAAGVRVGGGDRGKISEFSSGARRRMLEFMSTVKVKGVRITFMTLTFTEVINAAKAKRALKRFLERVRRKYPVASGVWRLEYQNRGAAHFHLLFFNLPFWPQRQLQQVWTSCTREALSICDVRLVFGPKQVINYVSKYVAKKPDKKSDTSFKLDTYQHDVDEESAGKHWGYFNRAAIPVEELFGGVLTDFSTIKALSAMAWEQIGADNRYGSLSFTLFTPFADLLCQSALARGGLDYDDYKQSHIGTETFYKVRNGIISRF